MALANLVNFLIIFYLLKRFAFKPIKEIIDKRKSEIETGLDNAEKARVAMVTAGEEALEIKKDAKMTANEIVASGQKQAEDRVKKAEKLAEEKKAQIIEEGRQKLKIETSEAESRLKRESVDLIVEGVEKILKTEFSSTHQAELIKNLNS